MSRLTRRRFVLLTAVALLGTACGPSAAETVASARGSGTVYRAREVETPHASTAEAPTPEPTTTPAHPAADTPAAAHEATHAEPSAADEHAEAEAEPAREDSAPIVEPD